MKLSKYFSGWYLGLAVLLILFLSACSSVSQPIPLAAEQTENQQHATLYIVVQRNWRLPKQFTEVLQQTTSNTYPNLTVLLDDNAVNDQSLSQADWVMTIRSSRIHPSYTLELFDQAALNAVSDCKLGGALGLSLFLVPCSLQGDEDYLEAVVRDAQGNTLKTYQLQASQSGFIWLLFPSLYIDNLDVKASWQTMLNNLYTEINKDQVFSQRP